ncbi:tripartite tricarboxylate transporter TctB family protein [Brevibacillus choshinensis]|uniref:Tripartite tricarboxylate transporter TctB family protein n=1 Tax=Brevibacillus choshinensis TaxID=54911 RepID=A0ABX7FGX4_BRECH|nr:tripartite tricarboxylate transporter TctB family protein [Brevibacillus choshinensis]QRG65306.1 tripartite tricarboxylate transporter TctB family protein [Brevibacillus choshinensis]
MNLTFDRFGSILFALIGAMFVVESRSISASAYGSQVGPNIFPLGLGIILILLSLRSFWETLKKKNPQATNASEKGNYRRFLSILAATLLYVFLLEVLGYVISTFLFLAFAFRMMGNGSLVKSIVVSLAFSAGVYYLYVYLLQGTLPPFPAWLGFGGG